MITASAPGKLMLFGEHAVVYGQPCLVTAINTRLEVSVKQSEQEGIQLNTPGNGNHAFITEAVAYASTLFTLPKGISISTQSGFSGKYGFGSSSAVTVATLKALSEMSGVTLLPEKLFQLAYDVIMKVQGVGSGFDVASAIYGSTILYKNKGEILEKISHPPYCLVVGYSGQKANTVSIVENVAKKKDMYPEKIEKIFSAIGQLTLQAKEKMIEGEYDRVGKLMDFNQEYLRDLGVSTEKIETLILSAKNAGAWGAKISGAGGGDCIIALCSQQDKQRVSDAIAASGGEVVNVMPDAEGVMVTTDNQDELFVIVDQDDTVIASKTRRECHSDPTLIHRAVGVVVTNDSGEILLQKRSLTKDTDPGKWGISAAGHVTYGEEPIITAQREIQEELGIQASVIFKEKFLTKNLRESEMEYLYTAKANGPFKPNSQEVERVQFFHPREIPLLVASKKIEITSGAEETLKRVGIL